MQAYIIPQVPFSANGSAHTEAAAMDLGAMIWTVQGRVEPIFKNQRWSGPGNESV